MAGALLCVGFVILILQKYIMCLEFRHEMAKVDYVNPKYVAHLSLFTSRVDRRSSYTTVWNATSMQPWGNNATVYYSFRNIKTKAEPFELSIKCCDILNVSWVQKWIRKNTNIPYEKCPVPAGEYYASTDDIPKDLVMYLNEGDYKVTLGAHITATKEKMAEISVVLRHVKSKTKAGKGESLIREI